MRRQRGPGLVPAVSRHAGREIPPATPEVLPKPRSFSGEARALAMGPTSAGQVPPIRIEVENEWAWCGARRLDLPPRIFALLRHLVEHPRRLLTKEELFTAVWGPVVVGEAALTSCVRDLRKALGDSSHAPRYIETVHRRGFRFIGPIATGTG